MSFEDLPELAHDDAALDAGEDDGTISIVENTTVTVMLNEVPIYQNAAKRSRLENAISKIMSNIDYLINFN